MNKSTSNRIYYMRKARGLTQEELGAKVGVTKATINKYETGIIINLPRPKIERLADALDVSPGYLMGWEDNAVSISGSGNIVNSQVGVTKSEEEAELLTIYRKLPVKARMALLQAAFDLEEANQ